MSRRASLIKSSDTPRPEYASGSWRGFCAECEPGVSLSLVSVSSLEEGRGALRSEPWSSLCSGGCPHFEVEACRKAMGWIARAGRIDLDEPIKARHIGVVGCRYDMGPASGGPKAKLPSQRAILVDGSEGGAAALRPRAGCPSKAAQRDPLFFPRVRLEAKVEANVLPERQAFFFGCWCGSALRSRLPILYACSRAEKAVSANAESAYVLCAAGPLLSTSQDKSDGRSAPHRRQYRCCCLITVTLLDKHTLFLPPTHTLTTCRTWRPASPCHWVWV